MTLQHGLRLLLSVYAMSLLVDFELKRDFILIISRELTVDHSDGRLGMIIKACQGRTLIWDCQNVWLEGL